MKRKVEVRTCAFGASVMLSHIRNLAAEIEGVESSNDVEFIHRMRVASRRLRSSFFLFQDCFPAKKIPLWQGQIRRVTKSLGAARDLDVQIEALRSIQKDITKSELRPGVQRLELRIRQRRAKIQPRVMDSMGELKKSKVLEEMENKLTPRAAKEGENQPYTLQLYELAHQAITTHLDALQAHEELILDPLEIAALHAMRIDGKHLRYTLEIFAPLYGGSIVEFISWTKTIQETLGNIHDCDVWIASLPDFIRQEKRKTGEYYGREAPFNLLLPGLNYFLGTQKSRREELYTQFIDQWTAWKGQQVEEGLRHVVNQPISFKNEVFPIHSANPAPENQADDLCE